MGWGLGKNSPVVLSFSRENYEALIERHGQWVRWRVAVKCPCVVDRSNAPQPNCVHCHGSGEIYRHQKTINLYARLKVVGNIINIPSEFEQAQVSEVYDYTGFSLAFNQLGQHINLINPKRKLINGEMLDVVFTDSLLKTRSQAVLIPQGNNTYTLPDLQVARSSIEGVYYRASADIIAINKVLDAKGKPLNIKSLRRNMIILESSEGKEPYTAYNIEYMPPVRIVVLSQNLQQSDTQLLQMTLGDAIASFPYAYSIGIGDVISLLSGTQRAKVVLPHKETNDRLNEFLVEHIESVETLERKYEAEKDYRLEGTNELHWIKNEPEKGTKLSIQYDYYPTYRVVHNLPQLRSSEDQRIARKVVLKLLSNPTESRGINKQ